jgi:DNA repair exonuclease SbcCD ATPase subunit/DNA repair exonuclease SbcCD nuclease subunit
MKILHTGDIHIRGLSRHKEYRASFEKMNEMAREIKPDIIYIGGDIVHSKTQGISPELIDLVQWWFTSLAEIAPTHIILGNHDGLIKNKDRQDAITPIVNALNNPNIHLYKASGNFPIAGYEDKFVWNNFSCFDEDGWEDIEPEEGKINIALFHGAVRGSKTDTDWTIEGEVDVDFFDRFDFSLLADIHQRQIVDDHGRVRYPGSLIQQNYGENTGKGFLVWDIRDKDDFSVKYYELEHTCPFVTIDWQDNVKDTIEIARSFPNGSRFRIRSNKSIPQSDIIHLHSELKHEKEAAEIVYKIDEDFEAPQIIDKESPKSYNLRDSSVHSKLFKKFYQNSDLDKEKTESLDKLITRSLSSLSKSDEVSRNAKWNIHSVDFNNTFSYGKNNSINFDKLRGITGIFGPNRSGKSSIIGTMMYGMFNTTDRGPIKNVHIINSRKGYCDVTTQFSVNGKKYQTTRTSTKSESKKGVVTARTDLTLDVVDATGSITKDMDGEQRRETEVILRNLIGTSEDFLMTSLASQGGMNNFIGEKATKRKMILTKFLDLDIFEGMQKFAKAELDEVNVLMKDVPDRDWDVSLYSLNADLDDERSSIQKLESELSNKRQDLQTLQIELNKLDDADIVTQVDVENQQARVEKLEEKIKRISGLIDSRNSAIETIQLKIDKIESFKENFPYEQLSLQIKEMSENEKTLLQLTGDLKHQREILNRKEKSINKLSEVPCGDSFPTCKFIKDSFDDKNTVQEQIDFVNELQKILDTTQRTHNDFVSKKLEDKLEKYNEVLRKESTARVELANEKACLAAKTLELSTTQETHTQATTLLEKLKRECKTADVSDETKQLKTKISTLNTEINDIDSKRMLAAQNIGRIETEISTLNTEREKYSDLKNRWEIYKLFIGAVSKKGIPLQIIMSQLPNINKEITKILQNTVGFTVELEADPNTNAMDIYVDYGDSKRVVELASGMEKMIASLAIRVALINVSSLPKTNMLIIDEGFGALDELNVEMCGRLLTSLKQYFKNIMIISHVDAVKDIVDNIIEITSDKNNSHVSHK